MRYDRGGAERALQNLHRARPVCVHRRIGYKEHSPFDLQNRLFAQLVDRCDDVPDGEADPGAYRADDHLDAGAQEGQASHSALGDPDREQREERGEDADGERDVEREEEVRPQRDDRGDEVRGPDDDRVAERIAARVG